MFLLHNNLAPLAKLAEKATSHRFAMTGVLVEGTDDGGYHVAATNGKVLGEVTGKADDAANYPDLAAIASAPNGKTSGLVPVRDFTTAMKDAPKKGLPKPILGNVAVVMGENQATLASTDLDRVNVSQPRLIDGRYPAIEHIYPGKPVTTKIVVNAHYLAELLKVAATFSPDDGGRVTLLIRDASTPIEITTANTEQSFRGLIMPLT